jgi:SAM-dependent methyltransferase
MYDLNKAYTKKFFKQRRSLHWRVPIVADAIVEVLHPKHVIDVGCGNGDLVVGLQERVKYPVYGIEGAVNALDSMEPWMENYVFIRDIRRPGIADFLLRRMDLAICFEVAEHIESEYSDAFVDNLCAMSDTILMSAAPPGQGGKCHVNCQPWSYWFHKFSDRGYRHNHDVVDRLKARWEAYKHRKGIKAYYNNLMCWEVIS